ncbi:MAG: hypothetical protein K0B05_01900 [Bacteroidales bacterium]|nr:hypothetical protein [Bacteroidales bacterium]
MKQEFSLKPISGYLALLIEILLIGGALAGFAYGIIWLGVICTLLFVLLTIGFTVVNPNESCVMVLFGAYKGTVRENGFFWVNPFYTKRKISLRARNFDSEPIKVNDEMEREIRERLLIAGIEVIEARINYIAYAEEIANAMLRRQQASAVVSARFKIVEGAVSMVQMALEQLSDKNIVDLDEEKKAAMVSNLMVVLCGDKDATPIVNTGTLHS